MNHLVEIVGLRKSFYLHQRGTKEITGCQHVNLTLRKGEFIGITGKSGAGKSTILKSLYRTYVPSEGELWFSSDLYGRIDLGRATEQQMIRLRQAEIGYVSQFLRVLPRITAKDVVKQALLEVGVEDMEAERQAARMLDYFRIPQTLWDAFPNTFSGGEKLRLNLARSMVKRPKLLLLDEPTASLDNASKWLVKEMIQQLKEQGVSMIGIFHDLEFMDMVVDTTYVMENGLLNMQSQKNL